jgi:HSP20 family molecular chaperone IbpA
MYYNNWLDVPNALAKFNNNWFSEVASVVAPTPTYRIVNKDNSRELTVDLPGVDKKDIKLFRSQRGLDLWIKTETEKDTEEHYFIPIHDGWVAKGAAKVENGQLKLVLTPKEDSGSIISIE